MATVALSGIITPSNVVTATSTTTLSNKTLVAPVLGTPASGVATNLTGLPAAGVVGTAAILGANTFTGAQKWATALNIASAATVDLNAATTGNRAHITGTVAITAWTLTGGPFTVIFDAATPLTYHATTNRLNSGATNYTTTAGDTADIYSDGTTVYVNVTKVAGNVGLTANVFTGEQTFKEVKDTVFTIADAAAFEIDPLNGSVQIITLGASRTPAATNFEAGQTVLLGVDDGAAFALTWTTVAPVWVKVGGNGIAPTLATAGYTWILFTKIGTVIYGTEWGKP